LTEIPKLGTVEKRDAATRDHCDVLSITRRCRHRADSTSSVPLEAGYHYFNFNQKVFEIGENSTIGAVTWGLGGVGDTSYRTLFASLADTFDGKPPGDMMDVSTRWSDVLWPLYSSTFSAEIAQCLSLHAMPAFDPNATGPAAGSRTKDEEGIYQR
jgi:hypothetical protein